MSKTIVFMVDTRNNINNESDCVHVASSKEKAQQWIEKNGLGWYPIDRSRGESDYFFGVVPTVLDKEEDIDDGGFDTLYFFDKYGNELDEQPF